MEDRMNEPNNIFEDAHFEPRDVPIEPNSRELVKWKAQAQKGPFAVNPDRCRIWSGNTRDVAALNSPNFADLIESLNSVGQKVPVIARVCRADPAYLEIIAGACRLTAITQINAERSPEDRMLVLVELRELDEEAAFKIVDAENRGRSQMSAFEQARFYQSAMERIYYTEAALAEALALNKSTVNRTLAITRLPEDLFRIIADPHRISAAQASAFISDWNKPQLQETLSDTIADLLSKPPVSATTAFNALRDAVEPPAAAAQAEIVHDGINHGSVRRSKSGLVIKLRPSAENLILKPLVISIGKA
jgi:ParB family transcriptional regulator, chromosome partitioning protein